MAILRSFLWIISAWQITLASPNPSQHFGSLEHQVQNNVSRCRCFPGEECWPSSQEWAEFNRTLNGKLIATIPIASVCHNDSFAPYDEEACERLRSVWDYPETHYVTSSSPMAPFFANMSCDPFTPRNAQCVIGSYVQYAINTSSIDDYRSALTFVRKHNIRLVIRNTGHDYMGKSTGAGALAIWTHHLKNITAQDYNSPYYTGKALTMGAGIMVLEANQAAHSHNLVVVAGDCQSVGVAGGYTQGGGHGPLASTFGLGADQVLEWEVVTGNGEYLRATPTENSDLYWALSGGGGGTYGIVYSLTVKAYPDFKVASANLTFSIQGVSEEAFYSAIQTFLTTLPGITDAGIVCIWLLTNTSFTLSPMTAPNLTSQELQALIQPTLDDLEKNNVPFDYFIKESPTYLDNYLTMDPIYNITEANLGGRLIPRSLASSNASTARLLDAMKFIVANNGQVSGVSINVTTVPAVPNSVNPVWRTALFNAVVATNYDPYNFEANIAGQQTVTDVFVPKLAELTPDGGAYLNEADFRQPDFQRVFYGNNYDRLLSIKHKYDPYDIFYGPTAVGSESWQVETDGRLCRTS
ncbi:FAD binding domain-containing protein [Hypoxylon sp. EC38]|nr:FAD binding domain-containing protein [Hypoxylon sp. EC38]